jgi:cytoskeletal protein RodZ
VDDERREPLNKARVLAWLTAGMLVAGIVSVGAVNAENEAEERRVVAAGQGADGLELPVPLGQSGPPVTPPLFLPPPATDPAPTTTAPPRPTTTAPTTTQPPRTTTTRPAVTATTAPTTATTPPTTAAQATSATVNVVNEHPQPVTVKVNGRAFTLGAGQQSGPLSVARSDHGNDTVEVSLVADPSCGMGDADGYFAKGGSYRMAVVAGRSVCQGGVAGPEVRVTPA